MATEDKIEDLITVHSKPLFIIQNRKQLKAYSDSILSKIIRILRSGPATIKEIASSYNKTNIPPKSEISIYNYVRKLEDVGLVINAGRRTPRFSTATENLYANVALVMIPMALIERKYWETGESKKLIEIARKLISFHTQKDDPSHSDLKELLLKVYSTKSLELSSFFDKNKRKINEIFKDSSTEEIGRVVILLSLVMIFRYPESYNKEFQQSFPEE